MAGIGNFSSTKHFTEDLKICDCTGVGFQTNQVYLRDGNRRHEHESEDRSFHYKPDDNIALYGIFDGECGVEASIYTMQEMPGQILLGQLSDHSTEKEIHEVLRQAFLSVERGYFQYIIDPLLVERVGILSGIPEGNTGPFVSAEQQRLEQLEQGITSGAAALVVLIFNGKLYVANAGDCRAQICVRDPQVGVQEIIQLTLNHDLKNEDEINRLRSIGVEVDRLEAGKINNQNITRCIGNYSVKGGYKEHEHLAKATSEPVIPEPEITSFHIDDSTNFLVLMSSGLYRALEEIEEHVNSFLAQMVIEEFGIQTTLNGVAQAVVDKIARLHQEVPRASKREDMTLLVRNFRFPFPIRTPPRASPLTDRFVRYPTSTFSSQTPTFTGTFNGVGGDGDMAGFYDTDSYPGTTETTNSSDSLPPKPVSPPKIKPYVDFSRFYNVVNSNAEFNENFFLLPD